MQLIKITFLFSLLLGATISVCQEKTTEPLLNYEYSNIVLALNRLESKNTDRTEKAQLLYDGLGYTKSADMFKSSLDPETTDRLVLTKLANAARLNAKYDEAVYWYEKVTSNGPLPIDVLHYAQALQATGNCKEAVKWFKLYNQSPAVSKVAFVENCDTNDQMRSFDNVQVSSIESLNTEDLDFSARPYKDGIVFTSNRGSSFFSRLIDNWTGSHFTDLYYAEKNEGGFSKPRIFKGAVNGKFHDGVAAFANDDTVMYFTRNDKTNTKKGDVKNLKIYQVENNGETNWSTTVELPLNGDDFSSCHPTVSKDGNTMYFSSDRPGGFGGMDIYSVTQTNGTWSEPENCGPSINTAGNEVFPFLTAEGDLSFSSNGHPGLGGLDIFVARQADINSNSWDRIVNAGKPFNSIKDDFGFYINEDYNEGYVSTSRVGGDHNDDILAWNSEEPVDFFPVLSKEQLFCVQDQKTGKSLQNATVTIVKSENENTIKDVLKTDQSGQFTLTVWPDTELNLSLSNPGYDNTKKSIDYSNFNQVEEECVVINLLKKEVVTISGSVVNKSEKNTPISNAIITVYNSCTKKEQTIRSDRKGNFKFEGPCDCEYSLVGEKSNFEKQTKKLRRKNIKCNENNEVVLNMSKSSKIKITSVKNTTRSEMVFMMDDKVLSVGSILPIKNINYDYNKSEIRSDAAIELDRVVSLMRKYPTLEIELGSYTDVRGNAEYNLKLSSFRASSALNYILSKGISINRASSRGYGESRLLNSCDGTIECTDKEHEENRRTEVKVIKLK